MAKFNRAKAPYYDDYDSSKQYTHLLAIPGRVAQAREITQIQSTVKDIIKSLGDSIMKNGNVIEGCQVIINPEKTVATVTTGKLYIEGMVLPVEETQINITGKGKEIIGIKLIETLITENEDNTLRDPAQGYDNYNQPGCHRVRSSIVVVKDDENAVPLVELIDGEVIVENIAPEYDLFTQTLARRTYDESGSYIVNGLKVRVEKYNNDDTKFTVVIESGKAYVLGYELKIPSARRLVLPRSTDYGLVEDFIFSYDRNLTNYVITSAPYVRNIISVKGPVTKIARQSIVSNTDEIAIDEPAGVNIYEIKQGNQVYNRNTDWNLIRKGTRYYIQWLGSNHFPTLNSEYTVKYSYTETFIPEEDYQLYYNPNTDSHELKWLPSGISKLNTNENAITFSVDYNQYLARKDVIYIDQYGEISVIYGNPAEYGFETAPESPVNTLSLAIIMSPPGGNVSENLNTKIGVSNIGLTRFTMRDIQNLVSRIRTMEYDQSILALNESAKQFETISTKRGVFADPLLDFSKIDYYYNLLNGNPIDTQYPTYDATIDLEANICYLPVNSHTYDTTYESSSSTKRYGRTVTLSSRGESVVLSQMKATTTFLVNPYSVFPQRPEISIEPAVDNWIEDTIVTIPVSQYSSEVIQTSARHVEQNNTTDLRPSWAISGPLRNWYRTVESSTSTSSTDVSVSETAIGTKVDQFISDSVVSEQSVTYIRPREIIVEGSYYPPLLNNISGYFDGVRVNLTPLEGTVGGNSPGTIRSDVSGNFKAKFTIPDHIHTGIREVRFESPDTVIGYDQSSAFALYQASGINRNIERTVTTLTTVLLERVTTTTVTNNIVLIADLIDPVGQTFVLDKMTLVKGIDLYFAEAPVGNTPVSCEIREVLNGNITSTVYGHKSLPATQVSVSSDGRAATRFEFSDPVLLEANKEYAFVVRSTSNRYRLWVANLGENDILTGEPVLSNPYLVGVMMSSSNNSSWTTHQTMDVKFRIIEDVYNSFSELYLSNISATEFSRIYLFAESIIPEGTSIEWMYSIDGGRAYRNISPYRILTLDKIYNNILFKAVLSNRTSSNISPIIALDSIGAALSCYDSSGCYITKNVTGLDEYTNVDIVLDTYTPSYTNIRVYVSTGGGLIEATLDPNKGKSMNYGWKEQTYKVMVPAATQCRLFVKMDSAYKYLTPSFRRVRMIMS